ARAREMRERRQSEENLRKIGAALRAYHARNGRFPPAAALDEAGKPQFSWRVLVLPYLGGDAAYRRFHLNRPWDHPGNAALLEKMPPAFASPRAGDPANTTRYQVIAGPGGVFDHPDGRALAEIRDGAWRTLLVVEGPVAVPWTKPDELAVTPEG